MISEKVREALLAGHREVYASVTIHDLGGSCEAFSRKLSELVIELEKVAPKTYFNFNGSAESYRIILSDDIKPGHLEEAIKLFENTLLNITMGWHFGALA